VLLAVSKATGEDDGCIPHIAAGLQGGLMAGEVCGAVSGAVLAIGLIFGQNQAEAVPLLTERFMRRFTGLHGEVRCIDIIGFNIGSADTKLEINSYKKFFLFMAGGGKRTCNKVVRKAVEAVCEEINAWEA
jgi:C_GCAxxG_C_C family probable redox protein